MSMYQSSVDVLEYWWILELFSPQKVPKLTGRAMRPEDRQVVEWRPGEALPWQVLQPPRPLGKTPRTWRHTVYLGVYDLEATYQRLHEAFAEDRDAYDERPAGLSACAGVLVDEVGLLLSDSAVLSSALWAVSKLAAGTSPRGTGWASGFAEASAGLTEKFDALDGARREAAGQELPPAQDEESLQRLLAAAHGAAGVAGDNELASKRVVIQSVAVSARQGEDSTTDTDFVNSFFLEDLAAVHEDVATNGLIGALADYLTTDTAVRTDARVDVMTNRHVVDDAVSIKRLPKGRWPADPDHSLALRQQFAVNQALTDLSATGGLMGVNGPPGTGKTTMLRDVLAANVVERARRLASLSRPADAFTQITRRWTAADGYPRRVRQLRDDLTGFEMVVTSANNAAMENVSIEIPARASIAEDWQAEADYFADIATATLRATAKVGESSPAETDELLAAWGLVAARLGSKSNRGTFRSEFWFDKTNPRTKQRIPGTTPRMQSRLLQWRDGEVPTRPWSDARDAFRQAERRVDELVEARRAAEDRLARFGDAVRAEAAASKHAAELEVELAIAAEAARNQAGDVERFASPIVQALEVRSRHVETRPSALETLLSLGRAAREWRNALVPLDAAVQEAMERQRASQERANQLEDARARLAAELDDNEDIRAQLSAELAALRRHLDADRDRYGRAYPGEAWSGSKRELRAPWLDAEIDAARSDLFLAALRLHEDFLAATAGDMLEGLRAATEVVAGAHPHRLEPEKVRAAWQLFFLVVPMVSTTFASFGRMFKGLGSESLGWVLIDEAGQACPQYAVGAIWRARRVITVGDPLQLQPVVTIPAKAQRDIAAANSVSDTWIPPRASVQTLADRISRHGTRLRHGEETAWVSAPLTVHRRCDEPMFSLFNDIAYNGIMVSGVTRRPDHFDSPNGARISVSCWLDETATTAGTHLQRNQIARLRRQIEALMDAGIAADDMIAISPFREVADHLARLDRDYPGLRAGTIHTAQGREADVVFLVLGGDPTAPGAKAWAAATVNLVNVSTSPPAVPSDASSSSATSPPGPSTTTSTSLPQPSTNVVTMNKERELTMGHTTNCETAKTYSCVCPCGGARHGAILIRGIATSDAATQVEATDWAEPRRWTRLPKAARRTTVTDRVADRHPAVTGIVSELVIALVEQTRSDGEIDAVAALAHQISDEIGEAFERHLDGGGPAHRSTRHLWCVVLATICRLYDRGFNLVNATLDDLVENIVEALRGDISTDRGEESQPRDIYQYRYRTVAAFEVAEYAFLEALVKKAVHAVTTAVKEIGEEAVFKHLRLIGAITCPDPDRHPDVVKYCLWPLLSGPFKETLEASIATEMRTWLRNAYPVVPAD